MPVLISMLQEEDFDIGDNFSEYRLIFLHMRYNDHRGVFSGFLRPAMEKVNLQGREAVLQKTGNVPVHSKFITPYEYMYYLYEVIKRKMLK